MPTLISFENVIIYHNHFSGAAKIMLAQLPDYFKEQAAILQQRFDAFSAIYYERQRKGIDTKSMIQKKNEWVEKADDMLRRLNFYLKSQGGNALAKDFFGSYSVTRLTKDAQRFTLLNQILEITSHNNHKDVIKIYIPELTALRDSGRDIFSAENSEESAEVIKLNAARDAWMEQYGKVKGLFKAYCIGTPFNTEMLFRDALEKSPNRAKKNNKSEPEPQTTQPVSG